MTTSTPSTSEGGLSPICAVCKVCAMAAHGLHFGVLSCRACAAFFRRSVVMQRQKKYKCRGGKNNCKVDNSDRYQCRFCRFNKCEQLGMTPENVQFNRDSIPTTRKRKGESEECDIIEEKLTPMEKYGSLLKYHNSSILKPKEVMDVSALSKKIKRILEYHDPSAGDPKFNELNTLQKLEYGLLKYREGQKPKEELEALKNLTIRDAFAIFEQQMISAAEWLTHCDQFRKLQPMEKYKFFKLVWNIWRRLERFDMTVRMFGKTMIDEKILAFSKDHLIKSGQFVIDFSEVSDTSNEQIEKMFRTPLLRLFDVVAKPLLELKPTTMEITYLMCQMCWQKAAKKMQGNVLEVCEKVRDTIGDELHDYYHNKEVRTNYAGRLVRLMGIVHSMEKIHVERNKLMELARIFDVFKVDFSEPDIFDE